MIQRRRKGDLHTYDLADLSGSKQHEGIGFSVRHEGLGKLREWQFAVKRILIADKRRLKTLREGLTEADAPELFAPDIVTPESEQDFLALMRGIVAEACSDVYGPGVPKLETGQERAAYLEDIGAIELVYNCALRQQSLDPEHIFTAGPGDDGSSGPTEFGPDA